MEDFSHTEKEKSREIRDDVLLQHELHFVKFALLKANQRLNEANRSYGDAVANSGGDWALDDPVSMQAAREAHIAEQHLNVFKELEHATEIPYPDTTSEHAVIGSRVTIQFESDPPEVFDILSRSLPGLPLEEGVTLLSAQSPIGRAIIGSKSGDQITWTAANGKEISAKLLEVDQSSQKEYYEPLSAERLQ